jgi:hypothetical protein
MKPICLDLGEYEGLEDLLPHTSTIKNLHDGFGQKITILSKNPSLFKENPFVEKSYKKTSIDIDYFRNNYFMCYP